MQDCNLQQTFHNQPDEIPAALKQPQNRAGSNVSGELPVGRAALAAPTRISLLGANRPSGSVESSRRIAEAHLAIKSNTVPEMRNTTHSDTKRINSCVNDKMFLA